MTPPTEPSAKKCGCRHCLDQRKEWNRSFPGPGSYAFMVVCAICGNKRCPHATDHINKCTNSNEPGQKGSAYE